MASQHVLLSRGHNSHGTTPNDTFCVVAGLCYMSQTFGVQIIGAWFMPVDASCSRWVKQGKDPITSNHITIIKFRLNPQTNSHKAQLYFNCYHSTWPLVMVIQTNSHKAQIYFNCFHSTFNCFHSTWPLAYTSMLTWITCRKPEIQRSLIRHSTQIHLYDIPHKINTAIKYQTYL